MTDINTILQNTLLERFVVRFLRTFLVRWCGIVKARLFDNKAAG
jgi:hypothetical protein